MSKNSEDLELEELIRSAGNYVIASDNLRPRILEEARENARARLGRGRIVWLLAAGLLCAIISLPLSRQAERLRARTTAPSAAEMHQRARTLSQQAGIGANWALYEAFVQLKDDTAVKMAGSDRSKP